MATAVESEGKLPIWTNRLKKEMESLPDKLPPSCSVVQQDFQAEDGRCRLTFHMTVEEADLGFGEGQEVVSGAVQEVIAELDCDLRDNSVILPDFEVWTPAQSVSTVLASLRELIATGGPLPDDSEEGGLGVAQGGEGGGVSLGQALNLDLFEGTIYSCHVKTSQGRTNRYLGVSSTSVVDLEAHKTKINWVVVVGFQPLTSILKLKFRRGLSITILFRDESLWEFEMEDSGDCVQTIQEQLSKVGIQGKRTTLAAANQIDRAKDILLEVQRKEKELADCPTLERVNEVCNLYREATEKFAAVSNEKHQEVLEALHSFLQRPDVVTILEGKQTPPNPPRPNLTAGLPKMQLPKMPRLFSKGEILQRHPADVLSEDDDGLSREENRLLKYGISQLKKMMDFDTGGLGAAPPASSSSSFFPSLGFPSTASYHRDESSLPSQPSDYSSSDPSAISQDDGHVQDLEGLVTRATNEFAQLSRGSGEALATTTGAPVGGDPDNEIQV